ncbi:MAG: hypothetical protein C4335_03720 [Armatimonadota bacterium]
MRHLGWCTIMVCLFAVSACAEPTIGILHFSERQPTNLQQAIRDAVPRAQVVLVSVDAFASGRLPQGVSLLVVPEAHRLPAMVGEPLQAWIRARKGVLFVSDAIPLQTWLYRAKTRWVERQEALLELATWRPLWQGQFPPVSAWLRATNAPHIATSWSRVDTPHGTGWRITVPQLSGWCTYNLRMEPPFREGETLMSFWAKGDANTRALSIEWQERDGSRWVATVALSTAWQRFALSASDFAYWPDNPSKGRGAPGDHLQPQNAVGLSIGLAQSFASYPPNTPLEATIADIRIGKIAQVLPEPPRFVLEGIAPAYKFYTDSRGRPRSVMRYCGAGIGGEAPGRRILTPLGERCCLFLSAQGDTAGGLWGWIPASEANARKLATLLHPALRGWHLLRAGTAQFGFWLGEPVQYGAEVANRSTQPVHLRLTARLSSPAKPAMTRTLSVHLQAGERRRVLFPPGALSEGEWRIAVTATADNGARDSIEHSFHVVGRPPEMPLIEVREGRFYRAGKPFYAHGINFWPLWIAGQEEPGEYWQYWLSPGQYDPSAVERALRIAKQVGFNVLSVQYTHLSQAPQLVDFLYRASRLGIYVNLFITAGHPFGFDADTLKALIQTARLPQWGNLFAYDIAWEPVWGTHAERKRFDSAWRAWIVEQYGSIENAERDWGYHLPREDGEVTNPTDEQILNDGAWQGMVAAYRRFLDDHVNRAYWRVVRFIRSIDPSRLIGARTGYGGNGNPWADIRIPYDLLAGAPFLDFVSPEGYSLAENWQNFRAGGFITAYARWAGHGKPVFWAEFGASIYPQTTPERIAYQRNVYEWMYRMIEESRADGSAGWWFPGGLRVDENSDFGIVHPDGTLRPAAKVAQQWAQRLAQIPQQPDTRDVHVITFDRDLHPRGFSQVWARHRQEYLQAVAGGKRVVLRTAGTGTTSENVPLVAVGEVACNGSNPPKYLNAQILRIEAVHANGETREIGPDQPLPADTLSLRVTVMNTGEATWLPAGKREVSLHTSWGAEARIEQAVARYEQVSLQVPLASGAQSPARMRMALKTEEGKILGFGEQCLLKIVYK